MENLSTTIEYVRSECEKGRQISYLHIRPILEFMDANEQRAEIETNEKLRLYDDLAYHKMMNLFWAGFAVFMGIVAILSHVL